MEGKDLRRITEKNPPVISQQGDRMVKETHNH